MILQLGYNLINKKSGKQLLKSLHTKEVDCKCGHPLCSYTLFYDETALAFQKTRDEFGGPLKITSFYRCATYNNAVGGVKNSMHTRGQATDLQPWYQTEDLQEDLDILEIIMKKHYDYIKRYNTFIHGHCFNGDVDTRKKK